ncbi:hypothetical protein GCM10020331_055590 [Ectobacillus funiculus]
MVVKHDDSNTKISSTIHDSTYLNRNLWAGILFGLGLVAFIDEAVFHQLLHWHHFYDKATTAISLISDGLFFTLSAGLQRLGRCFFSCRPSPSKMLGGR